MAYGARNWQKGANLRWKKGCDLKFDEYEIINSHNNVFMTSGRGRVTLHKVNNPFTKWTCSDNRAGLKGFVP
jgi:hypothetical protein